MNTDLHGYIPDMTWRDAKLIVEIDGWDPHRHRDRFEADRRKDVILATHGWITLRFTPRRIRDEPYAVIAEIAMCSAGASRRSPLSARNWTGWVRPDSGYAGARWKVCSPSTYAPACPRPTPRPDPPTYAPA